jgi:hypothetical protein
MESEVSASSQEVRRWATFLNNSPDIIDRARRVGLAYPADVLDRAADDLTQLERAKRLIREYPAGGIWPSTASEDRWRDDAADLLATPNWVSADAYLLVEEGR